MPVKKRKITSTQRTALWSCRLNCKSGCIYGVMRANNGFMLNAKICLPQILTFSKMLLLLIHVTTVSLLS